MAKDAFEDMMLGLGDSVTEILDDEEADEPEHEPISLEEAVDDLKEQVKDAISFMETELHPQWQIAEEFYAGRSEVKKQEGRSQVTSTEVRDAVRKLKPSAMRVFTSSSALVQFLPFSANQFYAGQVSEQQTIYCNQLFWRSNGYRALLDTVQNAFLKKVGILKVEAEAEDKERFYNATGMDAERYMALTQLPDVTILDTEEHEIDEMTSFYDVRFVHTKTNTCIKVSNPDLLKFFVDEEATSPDDATVIGERDNITVSEARKMGIEYDDWEELQPHDFSDVEEQKESPSGKNRLRKSKDMSKHAFLLTEVYAEYDLEGTGIAQLYKFYLGGVDYVYLHHERVPHNPYAVCQSDPMPNEFFGRSIFDLTREDQNTLTSLLRATCDNAHLSNNTRLAVHETMVNMRDVLNPQLGAPIRFRAPGMIQEIGVTSSVGSMLPLINELRTNSNNKVGVTDASVGLDPDALQSTDKDAVLNTIQLAQGQVELMVRNIAETGLVPLFRKMLTLSIMHTSPTQYIEVTGDYVPVDQMQFDPDMYSQPKVGMGNPDVQMKMAALQQVAQKQETVISELGFQNPIAPLHMLYNTYEDMLKMSGIHNIGRYFNNITDEMAQGLDQQRQQAAEAQQPPDPSAVLKEIEQIKGQLRLQEKQLELEEKERERGFKAIVQEANDDLKRDEMAQKRELEIAKIEQKEVNDQRIIAEQEKNREAASANQSPAGDNG